MYNGKVGREGGGGGWVVFFFFKQKTAYEIGTGDWSSDVCLPISSPALGLFDAFVALGSALFLVAFLLSLAHGRRHLPPSTFQKSDLVAAPAGGYLRRSQGQ